MSGRPGDWDAPEPASIAVLEGIEHRECPYCGDLKHPRGYNAHTFWCPERDANKDDSDDSAQVETASSNGDDTFRLHEVTNVDPVCPEPDCTEELWAAEQAANEFESAGHLQAARDIRRHNWFCAACSIAYTDDEL